MLIERASLMGLIAAVCKPRPDERQVADPFDSTKRIRSIKGDAHHGSLLRSFGHVSLAVDFIELRQAI
jgi:hypothetical protein